MEYAKLINNELIFAPSDITIGQTHYIPPHPLWLAENGYKPIRYTEAPTEEGKYAVDHWEEMDEEIVQIWELLPLPDEISAEEFLSKLEAIL